MPDASVRTLGHSLTQNGYQVFMREDHLYAFKGLAGKYGPLGVHASMLAIMAGVCCSPAAALARADTALVNLAASLCSSRSRDLVGAQ